MPIRSRLRRHTRLAEVTDVQDFDTDTELTSFLEDHNLTTLEAEGDPRQEDDPSSDGEPPATAPVVTVRPAAGALSISWTEPANADPLFYKVYISTTNNFTPNDDVNLRTIVYTTDFYADGLTNGTTYYVKVIACDFDGEGPTSAQASGTPTGSTPGGDGTQPATPNTPTVTPGIGTLFVRWTALNHSDVIKYEVHLGTTTGFTPSASTKCGTLEGELFVIRSLPPQGSVVPLVYGTNYWVKIVAVSGLYTSTSAQAGPVQIAKADTADIAVNAITAALIRANQIEAGHLVSDFLVSNTIIAGPAATGKRVTITASGVTQYANDGVTEIFKLDAVNQHATLKLRDGSGALTAWFDGATGNSVWYKAGTGSDRIRINAGQTDIEFINAAANSRRGAILYQGTDQLNILGGSGSSRSRIDVKSDRVTLRLGSTDFDGANATAIVDFVQSGVATNTPSMVGVYRARNLCQGGGYELTYPGSSTVTNPLNISLSGLFRAGNPAVVVSGGVTTNTATVRTLHQAYNLGQTGFTVRGYMVDGTSPAANTKVPGQFVALGVDA
jgi:hypothetical protein